MNSWHKRDNLMTKLKGQIASFYVIIIKR